MVPIPRVSGKWEQDEKESSHDPPWSVCQGPQKLDIAGMWRVETERQEMKLEVKIVEGLDINLRGSGKWTNLRKQSWC